MLFLSYRLSLFLNVFSLIILWSCFFFLLSLTSCRSVFLAAYLTMFTSLSKIKKARGGQPDACEENVAQAIYDLQLNVENLKATLRECHITSAREVENTVLIFVPVPQLGQWQKLIKERNLTDELEKKFSGKQVIMLAERRILPKESRKGGQQKQVRPRSRTLTHVHEKILEDMVYPAEIIGKRIRHKLDGSRLIKV